MRLNKFISETGLCSRREADAWITAGRVTVNGQPAGLGTQVEAGDQVAVDGRPVGASRKHVVIAFHKPVGVTCTTERHVPGNIIDVINHPERIFPIGRLDKDSEGLILLTNNGDIVNPLLRVENHHEKEYRVTVDRPIPDTVLRGLGAGVRILGTVTRPCQITREAPDRFRIVLTQGLNRQIRRMCEAFDFTVRRLIRLRFQNIRLDGLPAGHWRDLDDAELAELLAQHPEVDGARRIGERPVLRLKEGPRTTAATGEVPAPAKKSSRPHPATGRPGNAPGRRNRPPPRGPRSR